jgi:predicted nucleic acid-binding protein
VVAGLCEIRARSQGGTNGPEGNDSLTLAWCFPDEQATYPLSVLESLADVQAFVPELWHLEVANALLVGERRKRCTQADATTWLSFLPALPITVDEETTARAWSDILNLARSHNLSSYEAAYLELALRRGLPLASLDDRLKAAATAPGVPLYAP